MDLLHTFIPWCKHVLVTDTGYFFFFTFLKYFHYEWSKAHFICYTSAIKIHSILSKPEFYDFKQLASLLLIFPQHFSLSLFLFSLAIWVSMEEKLEVKFLVFFLFLRQKNQLYVWIGCTVWLKSCNLLISFFGVFVSWKFIY